MRCFANTLMTVVSLFALCSTAATAQQTYSYPVSSGTGFFVSNMGYVVTNAHVVKGCEKAVIKGTVIPEVVDIVSVDSTHDLALLRSRKAPLYAASLRDNIRDLVRGDKVLVMGFPGNRAVTGTYALLDAEVVDLTGPLGEPDSIQFSDSAQQGNSGGPLLDSSGNVIGVIVAKATIFQLDPTTQEKHNERHADVAISLNVLRNFLEQQGIFTRDLISTLQLTRDRIEDQAKSYIVNVQCSPKTEGTPASREQDILKQLSASEGASIQMHTNPAGE